LTSTNYWKLEGSDRNTDNHVIMSQKSDPFSMYTFLFLLKINYDLVSEIQIKTASTTSETCIIAYLSQIPREQKTAWRNLEPYLNQSKVRYIKHVHMKKYSRKPCKAPESKGCLTCKTLFLASLTLTPWHLLESKGRV
jgi:hypothetical protein